MVMKKDRYTEKAWESMGDIRGDGAHIAAQSAGCGAPCAGNASTAGWPSSANYGVVRSGYAKPSQQVPTGVDKNAYGRLSESDDLYHASFFNAAGPGGSGDGSVEGRIHRCGPPAGGRRRRARGRHTGYLQGVRDRKGEGVPGRCRRSGVHTG